MTDILPLLQNQYHAQKGSKKLVTISFDVVELTAKALADLTVRVKKDLNPELFKTHDAIVIFRDKIIQRRARIIWTMAYFQDTETHGMTPREKEIYSRLLPLAAELQKVKS